MYICMDIMHIQYIVNSMLIVIKISAEALLNILYILYVNVHLIAPLNFENFLEFTEPLNG